MVDAQAPGLAERLRALAAVPHSGPGWEAGCWRSTRCSGCSPPPAVIRARLPPPLRDTVRSRVGFTVRQADVLASAAPVRDRWHVLGRRDLDTDRIRTRRTWLRGRRTGRPALVLSFAAVGQPLDDSLAVGTEIDADLAFYPGAVALRALVAASPRHGARRGRRPGPPPPGCWPDMPRRSPRTPGWTPGPPCWTRPRPGFHGPACATRTGDALPLHPGAGDCWPLFALSGGRPLTVAGEWTPRGLWPLTAWDESGRPVPL